MHGFQTPEDAALSTLPAGITHVVQVRAEPDSQSAYVLLAVEVRGTGYYLDENICERDADGFWSPGDSCGGGFTDRALDDLPRNPPAQGIATTGS